MAGLPFSAVSRRIFAFWNVRILESQNSTVRPRLASRLRPIRRQLISSAKFGIQGRDICTPRPHTFFGSILAVMSLYTSHFPAYVSARLSHDRFRYAPTVTLSDNAMTYLKEPVCIARNTNSMLCECGGYWYPALLQENRISWLYGGPETFQQTVFDYGLCCRKTSLSFRFSKANWTMQYSADIILEEGNHAHQYWKASKMFNGKTLTDYNPPERHKSLKASSPQ